MKYFKLFFLNIIVIANIGSSMGIKTGINYSNQIITSTQAGFSIDKHFLNGRIIGLSWRPITLNNNHQLLCELLYVERGMIEEGINSNEDNSYPKKWEFRNTFYFTSANLLYRYNLSVHSQNMFFLIGPRVDKLLSKETDSGNYRDGVGYLYNKTVKNQFGIDIGSGKKCNRLTLEYRFSYNFFNSTTNDLFTINNYSHSVIIGLEFPEYNEK